MLDLSTVKEGDKIKVTAERRPFYAHHGYVETAKVTTRTLTVKRVRDNGSFWCKGKGSHFGVDADIMYGWSNGKMTTKHEVHDIELA